MNTQKINGTIEVGCPDGYEVDMEKSKFGLETIIYFKPIKKQLPKSWEELKEIKGHWIDGDCEIYENDVIKCTDDTKNLFATEAQAKASIALAQLSQLREVYRDGWVPDWNNCLMKYCIVKYQGHFLCENYYKTAHFLAFQSPEIRDEFFKNFKDLIEEASPLLFG